MKETVKRYKNKVVVTRVLKPEDEGYKEANKLFSLVFGTKDHAIDQKLAHRAENEENGHH